MKFSRYILGSLFMLGILTFGSCTDDTIPQEADAEVTGKVEDDGMVDVRITFNLLDEGGVGTRAKEDVTITDINDMDLFIYALRDSTDNVLKQYGQGVVDKELEKSTALSNGNYTIDNDNNQTLMKAQWDLLEDAGDSKIYKMSKTITLRVMRGTVFKLSCWAQSSETDAFDFNDFTAVKVRYKTVNDADENKEVSFKAENNDKLRDAFCATSIFSIGQVSSDISVTLTRPFAQVNVGVKSDASDKNNYNDYRYSSIKLGGVAKYFNVVDNKVWKQDAIDDYEKGLKAQIEKEIAEGTLEGNADELLKAKSIFRGDTKATTDVFFETAPMLKDSNEDLGTFTVHNYKGWNGETTTPIDYHVLSMCYVLVPDVTYNLGEDGNYEENATSKRDPAIMTSLTVYDFKGGCVVYNKAKGTEKDDQGKEVEFDKWTRATSYILDEDDNLQKVDKDTYLKGDAVIDTENSGRIIKQDIKNYKKNMSEDDNTYSIKLIYDIPEDKWSVKEVKDKDDNLVYDWSFLNEDEKLQNYMSGGFSDFDTSNGVIYPGAPNEQQVYLNLLELSLSDGTNTITNYPKELDDEGNPKKDDDGNEIPLHIRVKRNWRSNLLYETWGAIDKKKVPGSN